MALSSSELEYWSGSAWVKEDNLIQLTITDNLQEPLTLEAMIGNFSDAALNTREGIYTKFLKVRVKEKYSYKYVFYGKVSRTQPDRDNTWGHVVHIVALDNLRELSNLRLDDDISGQTTRSGLISNMITNHVWTSPSNVPNIAVNDSTKFKTSTGSEASGILDKTFKGDRKPILDIMKEVSREDPNGNFFGYDFYLDAEFNGNTATPDLFYFQRGSIPAGTMPASGLTIQFNATESNQVLPMMGDYNFPKLSSELITRTKVRWVDANDKARKTDSILINHGATSGGNFDIGDTITWSGSGSAKVLLVGTNNRWVEIGPDGVDVDDKENNSNWLNPISGLTISGGGASATVNSTTASPPGSLREAIEQEAEVVSQTYDTSSEKSAAVRGASILYQGGDIVVRGNLKTLKYPQYIISGTHTGSTSGTLTDSSKTFTDLGIFKSDVIQNTTDGSRATITAVGGTTITGSLSGGTGNAWDNGDTYEISVPIRAGHVIYIKDIPSGSNISDQSCLVTSIDYTEGPGIQIAGIKLLIASGGRGTVPPMPSKQMIKATENASSVPSNDQSGIKTRSSLGWATTIIFSPDGTNSHNTVDWSSGSIFFFDGSDFSISAGTTGAISAVTYIYFSKSTPTALQTTTSASTAQGSDNIILATCENVASGGTVTIETTTGVAQKNYYSMDALFDGAGYGRIAMGNLLSNNLNLAASSLAGSLPLNKTTDSSGRSTVTDNEKTGADRGYNGLKLANSRIVLSQNHFLNEVGIGFQSADASTWAGINSNGVIGITSAGTQFQIQATNGLAGFGGQTGGTFNVEAGTFGLRINNNGQITLNGDNAISFNTTSNGNYWVYGKYSSTVGGTIGAEGSTNLLVSSLGVTSPSTNNAKYNAIISHLPVTGRETGMGLGHYNWGLGRIFSDYISLKATSANPTFSEFTNTSSYDWGTVFVDGDDNKLYYRSPHLNSGNPQEVMMGGGISLSANNTWTGVNIFNGSYSTFTATVNIDGSSTFLDIDNGAILSCNGGNPPQFEDGAFFKDRSTPSTPNSGWGIIWTNSNAIYFKNDAGTVYNLTDTGGTGDIEAVYAGNGMTGGAESGNATITLGTPGTLTSLTNNNVSGVSHTHEVTGLESDDGVFYIQTDSGSGAKYAVSTHSNSNITTQFVGGTDIDVTNSGAVTTIAYTGSGGGGSGTVSSGTTNKFAYYSGSTTVSSANNSGSPAYLYTTGIYSTSSSIYHTNLGSGSGTDLVLSGSLLKTYSSSRRYKENIIDLAIDTSKVYDLVPRTFKWKDSEEAIVDEDGITDEVKTIIGATDFGLIAEEVHEILPELVIYNTANEPDAVRYKTIAVLLIEEMKKLKDRIEILEGN